MTAQEIITLFELQVDDGTELSSTEELQLLNRLYQKVCADRPWEFTKKTYTGTQSTSVPYITLPSDFSYLTQNHNYTEQSQYAGRPVIFVGTNFDPYKVVSWSDRRQYRNDSNVAYIDVVNSRLYFTIQPTTANAVEYDYHAVMPDLTLTQEPAFPDRFHPMLAFGMAAEDFVIQLSDKAKSYAGENQAKFDGYMQDLAFWNANLIQGI